MAFSNPRERRVLGAVLLTLLWADVLWKIGYCAFWQPMTSPNADWDKHWYAARAILNGQSPYVGNLYLGFNYPLFTGYLFIYLAWFKMEAAKLIWNASGGLLTLGGILILVRYMRPGPVSWPGEPQVLTNARAVLREYWVTVVFVTTMNFHPLLQSFPAGNVEPLNFFLFIAFAAALVRSSELLAGVLLAALCLVKIVPVLLLLPFFVGRRWKVLGACLTTLAIYALHLLVTGLWRTELFLYTDVLPRIGYHYLGISISLHHILALLVYPHALESQRAFSIWTLGINAVVGSAYVGVCLWWGYKRRNNVLDLLNFAMITAVVLSPLLEYHHLLWAAPVLFLQLHAWAEGRLSFAAALICLAGWLAINASRVLNDFVSTHLAFPAYMIGTVLAVVMSVICGWIALRNPSPLKALQMPFNELVRAEEHAHAEA